MGVRRIMPCPESRHFDDATRGFYTRVLKLEEGTFGAGYIGFGPERAQGPLRSTGSSRATSAWAAASLRCRWWT